MEMLRHYHVSGDDELVLYSDFFEDVQKKIFAARGPEQLPTVVATAGNKVEFPATVESLKFFWHAEQYSARVNPSHPSLHKRGSAKDGAPTVWKRLSI